jgi:hypothetical protein
MEYLGIGGSTTLKWIFKNNFLEFGYNSFVLGEGITVGPVNMVMNLQVPQHVHNFLKRSSVEP